jgi:hypothetical protein
MQSEAATSVTSTPERRSFLGSAGSVLQLIGINILIFVILAELVSLVMVHLPNWPSSRPSYRLSYNSFWADINPVFGVWHRPNGVFIHKGGCYSVEYDTNSYGARDAERSLHSSKPRTIVLGDSMVEGLGVPAEARLSNILERDTGREHLNFGTGGNFGPLQYALLYKSMAAAFDHDQVIVGVLPDNDFRDMDQQWWQKTAPGRYRPYYAADFSVVYEGRFDPNAGESKWDRLEAILRAYLASYHVGQYLNSRFYWRKLHPYSGYNDYTEIDLTRLKRSLEDIQSTADAHGAKETVILIPRLSDFLRLHQAGTNRLGPVMERWGTEVGIPIKDLLPEMDVRANGNFRQYFLPCDGHWSARGNAVAASIVEPWLSTHK